MRKIFKKTNIYGVRDFPGCFKGSDPTPSDMSFKFPLIFPFLSSTKANFCHWNSIQTWCRKTVGRVKKQNLWDFGGKFQCTHVAQFPSIQLCPLCLSSIHLLNKYHTHIMYRYRTEICNNMHSFRLYPLVQKVWELWGKIDSCGATVSPEKVVKLALDMSISLVVVSGAQYYFSFLAPTIP